MGGTGSGEGAALGAEGALGPPRCARQTNISGCSLIKPGRSLCPFPCPAQRCRWGTMTKESIPAGHPGVGGGSALRNSHAPSRLYGGSKCATCAVSPSCHPRGCNLCRAPLRGRCCGNPLDAPGLLHSAAWRGAGAWGCPRDPSTLGGHASIPGDSSRRTLVFELPSGAGAQGGSRVRGAA